MEQGFRYAERFPQQFIVAECIQDIIHEAFLTILHTLVSAVNTSFVRNAYFAATESEENMRFTHLSLFVLVYVSSVCFCVYLEPPVFKKSDAYLVWI